MWAHSKQPQAAVDVMLTSLAATQSLKCEPLLSSQALRGAFLGIDKDGLERVVSAVALSSADLDRLSAAFGRAEAEFSTGTGFTRALVTERAFFLAIPEISGTKGAKLLRRLTTSWKSQQAFAEETFNRLRGMRKEAYAQRLKAIEYFTFRMAEAKYRKFGLWLTFVRESLRRGLERELRCLAELRLAQTAIALEQFRLHNAGKSPENLALLTPIFFSNAPVEPFDGQSLRYRKTAKGYQLYSVGKDLKDDRGERMSRGGRGDLLFEVVKAPRVISS